MEGIKVKLPKLPTISFINNQRPSRPAYQDFLIAKTFEVCRAAGATESLIWWALPIIAPSAGPVLIIVSVARFNKARAMDCITSRFGCDWVTPGDSFPSLAPLPPVSRGLDQEWECVESDMRNGYQSPVLNITTSTWAKGAESSLVPYPSPFSKSW